MYFGFIIFWGQRNEDDPFSFFSFSSKNVDNFIVFLGVLHVENPICDRLRLRLSFDLSDLSCHLNFSEIIDGLIR